MWKLILHIRQEVFAYKYVRREKTVENIYFLFNENYYKNEYINFMVIEVLLLQLVETNVFLFQYLSSI